MTTDRIVFGMHHLNITQAGSKYNGERYLSHPSFELDLAGEDAGVDFWYNKMPNTYWYCAGDGGWPTNLSNTRFYWSCDANGRKKEVMCADGKMRPLTLAMTHSNKNYPVGTIIKPGQEMYREGRKAANGVPITGIHMHVEVCEGWVKTKKPNSMGFYNLPNMLDARKVFFILDGYTTVVNTDGLNFKHCSEVTVKDENKLVVTKHSVNNDLEQVNYYNADKSTRKIATSFHVYRVNNMPVDMKVKKFKYEGSNITAVQLVLNEYTQFELSYVGYRDWLSSLHNDWMLNHGFEEIMAMNAGYFVDKKGAWNDGQPIGAVLQNWNGKYSQFKGTDCVPSRNNGYPTLTWNGNKLELHNKYANEFDLKQYAWMVGVGQSLILNGKIDNSIGTQNGRYNTKVNATAIGYNHETNTLTFAINANVKLNTLQRSYMMKLLGCDIAVQLDGGGSAQLQWLEKAVS